MDEQTKWVFDQQYESTKDPRKATVWYEFSPGCVNGPYYLENNVDCAITVNGGRCTLVLSF